MKITLFAGLMLCFLPPCFANLVVTVTKAPASPSDRFYAQLAGASDSDPTPNPCYNQAGCTLRFFTISESWLPSGYYGYGTVDNGWPEGSQYRTVGEWVRAMRLSGTLFRSGSDYLPARFGNDPCVVIAAATGTAMALNTIISNCARGIVQAPGCRVTPAQLNVDFGTVSLQDLAAKTVTTPFSLQCNSTTDVIIETNTRELMPLNNSSDTVAEFDWGQGFGLPGKVRVTANTAQGMALRTRLKGFNDSTTGDYRGSTVVNISYY